MKNPIATLKHLVKDPVTTIEQADERKKELMPWVIGSIALAVVPGILAGIIDALGFLSIFSIIGVFAAIFFVFLLFVLKKAKAKFAALTCEDCNTMAVFTTDEEYEKYVTYTINGNQAVYNGISHPASNNGVVSEIKASASASVCADITITCPHCGKVRHLEYKITPFKCEAIQSKVLVRDVEIVKSRLESAVRAIVAQYNNPETRAEIPYTIHSVNHPNYENRDKPQLSKGSAYPSYNGVDIKYRKDPEEMIEQFFVHNQLDGDITVK